MGTVVNFYSKNQLNRRGQRIVSPVGSPEKRLYSIDEAAIYLGRSVWSVRELIWGGQLPYVKVGRRIHLDITDLDEWIAKNKVKHF